VGPKNLQKHPISAILTYFDHFFEKKPKKHKFSQNFQKTLNFGPLNILVFFRFFKKNHFFEFFSKKLIKNSQKYPKKTALKSIFYPKNSKNTSFFQKNQKKSLFLATNTPKKQL